MLPILIVIGMIIIIGLIIRIYFSRKEINDKAYELLISKNKNYQLKSEVDFLKDRIIKLEKIKENDEKQNDRLKDEKRELKNIQKEAEEKILFYEDLIQKNSKMVKEETKKDAKKE